MWPMASNPPVVSRCDVLVEMLSEVRLSKAVEEGRRDEEAGKESKGPGGGEGTGKPASQMRHIVTLKPG